jgi:hypothetical protein
MPWVSRSRTHFHTSSSILNSQLRVPQGGKSETSILHVLHVLHRTSLVLHPYFTVLHRTSLVLHSYFTRTSPYVTILQLTFWSMSEVQSKYEWMYVKSRFSPLLVLPRTSAVLQLYFPVLQPYFNRTSTVLHCTSAVLQPYFAVLQSYFKYFLK